jgi:mono/diheme cytochrome c family protein
LAIADFGSNAARDIIIRLHTGTKLVWLSFFLAVTLACNRGPSNAAKAQMSDAELGLTPQQAAGRHIYNQHCLVCHEAYATTGRNGPALAGFYQKKFMVSGQPVNDERVRDLITLGRSKMPAFGSQLGDDQIAALIAYMKTL